MEHTLLVDRQYANMKTLWWVPEQSMQTGR
jgi:hypothetical protein